MRKSNISAGRSINLALSQRGLTALTKAGLKDEILEICIPLFGRMMHSKQKELTYQSYSKDGKSCINSVSRGDLNKKFMTIAEKNGVTIEFESKCDQIDLRKDEIVIINKEGEKRTLKGETVLACDGAFSAARDSMLHTPRFNYSQHFLEHGYKELHMPPNEKGEHKMDKNCLHIWPRGSSMMIGLPNMDGSFTMTCFFPFEGEFGFDRLDKASDEVIRSFFETEYPDAVELIPDLVRDWKTHPTSSLVTIKCFPWSFEDKVCLFGDAAHAIVPFFGQGMNAAFEDCDILTQILEKNPDADWKTIFHKFQEDRKKNTDAIADMAFENFVEMRDLVADPDFLFKKKVQHLLGNEFPNRFNSRYELVSFSNLSYSECMKKGLINDKITNALIEGCDHDITKIDLKKAKELMDQYYPENN
eukprot:TRINITY_DN5425_c0_g2_i1.p1 TRINITY_DN5425_c0_g2~~TRINITY_DN5425_c0_g2_i1.p1  ORF type:complete len:468 (-),score=132.42 TRINITY_DN5425_c0_g2_i1:47-1297(-)